VRGRCLHLLSVLVFVPLRTGSEVVQDPVKHLGPAIGEDEAWGPCSRRRRRRQRRRGPCGSGHLAGGAVCFPDHEAESDRIGSDRIEFSLTLGRIEVCDRHAATRRTEAGSSSYEDAAAASAAAATTTSCRAFLCAADAAAWELGELLAGVQRCAPAATWCCYCRGRRRT
jgi:hypothetical protein